jgi:hypothetical protein
MTLPAFAFDNDGHTVVVEEDLPETIRVSSSYKRMKIKKIKARTEEYRDDYPVNW